MDKEYMIWILLFVLGYIFLLLSFGKSSGSKKSNSSKRNGHFGSYDNYRYDETEKEAYGKKGEIIANSLIGSVLWKEDTRLTNIEIEHNNQKAELDTIIINKYGVFVIEIKNYKGYLVGNEDDFQWSKYKTSYKDTFCETVKNPITQAKREAGILARYIEYYTGIKIWIDGYAMLVQDNSPVESDKMLRNEDDINRVIHTKGRKLLTPAEIEQIVNLLEPNTHLHYIN